MERCCTGVRGLPVGLRQLEKEDNDMTEKAGEAEKATLFDWVSQWENVDIGKLSNGKTCIDIKGTDMLGIGRTLAEAIANAKPKTADR